MMHSGQFLFVALAACPCMAMTSGGFLQPDHAFQDFSPVVSIKKALLQAEPTESLPTDEAKLEELQKQVKEQQAKVEDERNKIKTGAGMSVKEREEKAGKKAIEDLSKRQEMLLEQAKLQNINYEKLVRDMYQGADKKTLVDIDQQLAARKEVMDRQMKLILKNQKRLMEKRVSCMQEVPGDQSSYQKARINAKAQESVCETKEEKTEIQQWYKDNRQVEKCMQPVVDANVKSKIESRYQEINEELGEDVKLTKKEKAMVKEQMEAEKDMTDRIAKMSQAQEDRTVEHQFKCMADVCGTKAGESEEQRDKRTTSQYEECMQEKVIAEYARAVDELMGDKVLVPGGLEVTRVPLVEKTEVTKREITQGKEAENIKVKKTKVVVEKAEATSVTIDANTQGHSDKAAEKGKSDAKAAGTQTKEAEKIPATPDETKKVEKTKKKSASWMDPLKDVLNGA